MKNYIINFLIKNFSGKDILSSFMSTFQSHNNVIPVSIPLAPSHPSSKPTEKLAETTAKDKLELQVDPVQYYTKESFMITYILLLTTATITFIEAIRNDNPFYRNIMNLETCISIVAGYFYSVFLGQLNADEKENKMIDWAKISQTRYIDWSITTPMMLLVLCGVLAYNGKKSVRLNVFLPIVGLNYIMLAFGFLGENNTIPKVAGMIFGSLALFGMFYIIYDQFVRNVGLYANKFLYWFYFIIWSMYGVVYMFDETYKNILTNILDLTAKSLLGIGLWIYYTKIIRA